MSGLRRALLAVAALGGLCVAMARAAPAASEPIPRSALFGNPARTDAQLSPDGKYLAWLAPSGGVLNVFVAPVEAATEAKAVTDDRGRGVARYSWAHTGRHILYQLDRGGDENWSLFSVDIVTGRWVNLTPARGVQAQLLATSWLKPHAALVALNERVPEWHDLYEIDVRTGRRRLIVSNLQEFAGFAADMSLRPRVAWKTTPAGTDLYRRKGTGWERLLGYGQEDGRTTQVLTVEQGGRGVLMLSSVGRDKAALVRVDPNTGAQSVLAQNERADIESVWLHPRTNAPQVWRASYLKFEYGALAPQYARDLERLGASTGNRITIASRTLDDAKWIVVVDDPVSSPASYLYDRSTGTARKLFEHRPQLSGVPLAPMQARELRARDGLPLVSYLTFPPGADADGDGWPDAPLPLVLKVHGGPWWRDSYGFNAQHQWLASRGYAVLSVNFRGSTGFGKEFINRGNGEWAGRMHDDLLDALGWAVERGIALPEKVAIYGASYGGYAALVGMTFTPERFACGVSIVGPSNLNTLFRSIPAYWKAHIEDFAIRVGDWRTTEGRRLLEERSPLMRIDAIRRSLLIGQGANDPRVKQAESDQIVAAMKARHLPVTYVLYPDEGHGFVRAENVLSFYAVTESFFSKCLGGRYQQIGEDFAGSSIKVLEGADHVPGLAQALAGH